MKDLDLTDAIEAAAFDRFVSSYRGVRDVLDAAPLDEDGYRAAWRALPDGVRQSSRELVRDAVQAAAPVIAAAARGNQV